MGFRLRQPRLCPGSRLNIQTESSAPAVCLVLGEGNVHRNKLPGCVHPPLLVVCLTAVQHFMGTNTYCCFVALTPPRADRLNSWIRSEDSNDEPEGDSERSNLHVTAQPQSPYQWQTYQ